MKKNFHAISSIFIIAATATVAYAQLSKDEREDMAKTHEEVAACLRSEKALTECHQIMRDKHAENPERCRMFFGAKECPFGSKGMMKGKNGMKRPMSSPTKDAK